MRDFIYIDDTEQFRWLAVELAQEPLLALDTESNSLHAYRGVVCLVQLSTRDRDFIIDPQTITDLSPLGVLLADPTIEIVMHAAEYDLRLFQRDYDFKIENLFDTMVAARVLGHHYHGLASIMKHYFGVSMDKRHQRDNWGARPLPHDSLRYAQMDTHYLPELRDLLQAELIEMGRWEEAQELFEEAQHVPPAEDVYDPEGFWDLGRSNRLKKHEMGVLREVYLLREELAAAEDVPVFKIFPNKVLVRIARAMPRTLHQLSTVRDMPGVQVRRYGEDILDAVERGRQVRLPPPPPLPRPPAPEVARRYLTLQEWRKHKGLERGVESDVVLTKDIMWQLARHVPETVDELREIKGLGPQRIALYGDSILSALNGG